MESPDSYGLQAVLDLREAAVTRAQRDLARAEAALTLALEERMRCKDRACRAAQDVTDRQQLQRGLQALERFTGEAWQAERCFLNRLRREQERRQRAERDAARRVAAAEQASASARQALVEARRDAELLKRHRDRTMKQRQQERDRRAEREQDELAMARHRPGSQ